MLLTVPSINQISGPAYPWGGHGSSTSSWIFQAFRSSATKDRFVAAMLAAPLPITNEDL